MEYSVLADRYEELERTSSKIAKADIVAKLLRESSVSELHKIILLLQGTVYQKYEQMELGVANKMMIRAIHKATGVKVEDIEEIFKRTGDLGSTAEECLKKRKQGVLLRKKLTVDFVFGNLRKLAKITGVGSQERKLNLIAELIVSAKPRDARYIVRTILGELRVGVAEGILRDAIAKAFLFKPKMSKEERVKAVEAVEYAWNILSDYGEVAKLAKQKGVRGLRKVKVQLGKPIHVMLGLAAKSIDEVVKKFGKVAAEWKYDGMRTLIEKGDRVWVFTRRLEDVTKQFPDIVELAEKGIKAKECIIEGEAIGINPKTGLPLPFQQLSQRIQRKYDIDKLVKKIPIQVNLFDIVYLDGKMLFDLPYKKRRVILEKVIKTIPGKFQLTKQIVSDDLEELHKFYRAALEAKQEGLMLKVLDSPYTFGRHVGGWYKVKPLMENLDLVIVGANWGEGARARWLTSFFLACRDPDTGRLLKCGKMSTGLTEKQYEKMTKLLKPLIKSEKGRTVEVHPKLVIEVGYQEIQRSPNYESGFALRFPRLVRFRPDKKPEEADTIERVRTLFKSQGRAG